MIDAMLCATAVLFTLCGMVMGAILAVFFIKK